MPKKQKIARAETVLLMLGLKDCADLPVGGALLKGITGGEKRRLSLAVQSKSILKGGKSWHLYDSDQ